MCCPLLSTDCLRLRPRLVPPLPGHAQSNLAIMYQNGRGCEPSNERAAEWWARAAEQGHAGAHFDLGLLHEQGEGVPQSNERALELYKLGEAGGDARAANCLGLRYFSGSGVDHSYAEARRLYERAVARGGSEVAPANLRGLNDTIRQECPLLGQRVVLCGLNAEALNGTRAAAVDFGNGEKAPDVDGVTLRWVAASGRYTVRLDGPEGRLVKVRPANVEAGEEDWAGGAAGGEGDGGKPKKTGKKGRGRK